MELWDVYDMDRMRTGHVMTRGDKNDEGYLHLVVHVCIFNAEGRMLIQKRQASKTGWPGRWDVTVGGSAISGESSSEAAERELFEELGVSVSLDGVRPHLTMNFEHGFDDVYLLEMEVSPEELILQEEEVSQAKWSSKEEIIAMIDRKEFIPYHQNFIRLLFDMHCRYGLLDSME